MITEKNPYRKVLKMHRLSYVHLQTPVAFEDGAVPKYGVTVLIPKDHEDAVMVIDLIQQCYDENKHVMFKAFPLTSTKMNYPLRDGDEYADQKAAEGKDGEAYRGHYYLKASTANQPNVFDVMGEDVIDLTEVYSGCFARVSITLWPYNKKGQGFTFFLNSVRKYEDGEPLGSAGGSAAEYDEDEAPAAKPAVGRQTPPVVGIPAAAAPRPAAKPAVVEPVAQWATAEDGRDIYSWDGINWEYAE